MGRPPPDALSSRSRLASSSSRRFSWRSLSSSSRTVTLLAPVPLVAAGLGACVRDRGGTTGRVSQVGGGGSVSWIYVFGPGWFGRRTHVVGTATHAAVRRRRRVVRGGCRRTATAVRASIVRSEGGGGRGRGGSGGSCGSGGSPTLERVVVRALPRAGGHARILMRRAKRERGHVSVCEGMGAGGAREARRRGGRVRAGQPLRGDITRRRKTRSTENLDRRRWNAEGRGAEAVSSRTWNGLGSARSSKGLSAMVASVSRV